MGARTYPNIEGKAYPIREILEEKIIPTDDMLNFSEIDGDISKNLISGSTERVGAIARTTEGLAENIKEVLQSLQSDAFYNGPEAQAQIANLNETISNMKDLLEALNTFDNEDIKGISNQYNEKLKTCSNNVKMNLLKKRAKEINAAATSGKGKLHPKYKVETQTYAVDGSTGFMAPYGEGYKENTYAISKCIDSKIEGIITMQTYETRYYKYINYWGWIDWEGWPWDILDIKEVKEFEDKFAEIQEELPYKK